MTNYTIEGVPGHVARCVKTILTTPAGTVPLDRAFGIGMDALDLPIPQARALMTNEILTQLKRYEPRVGVKNISFSGDAAAGEVKIKVVCELVSL